MIFERLKQEYKVTKAFKKLFYDEDGKLKPEGEVVLTYLRDVCNAKGERAENGTPFLYSPNGQFDSGAAAYLLGRRRVFDMIVKHLALNEVEIFNLLSVVERNKGEFERIEHNLDI